MPRVEREGSLGCLSLGCLVYSKRHFFCGGILARFDCGHEELFVVSERPNTPFVLTFATNLRQYIINEGSFGRLFEVTPDGDVVWEFVNSHFGPATQAVKSQQNGVFRAYRYSDEEIALARG